MMAQDRHMKIDTGGSGGMGQKEKEKQGDTVPHAALAVVAGLGEISLTNTGAPFLCDTKCFVSHTRSQSEPTKAFRQNYQSLR